VLQLSVLSLQFLESLGLVQLHTAELFLSNVAGLRRYLGTPAGLWGDLSVGDFQYNLP
jgi:hypothetical protein